MSHAVCKRELVFTALSLALMPVLSGPIIQSEQTTYHQPVIAECFFTVVYLRKMLPPSSFPTASSFVCMESHPDVFCTEARDSIGFVYCVAKLDFFLTFSTNQFVVSLGRHYISYHCKSLGLGFYSRLKKNLVLMQDFQAQMSPPDIK